MIRKLYSLLLACGLTALHANTHSTSQHLFEANQIDSIKMESWVDSVYHSLNVNERVGQMVMPVFEVKTTTYYKNLLKKYVEEYDVGGILFSKGTLKDQAILTNYGQSLAQTPLMITLDGEWGLAMRLTDAPRFPRNMMLGAIGNDSLIYAYAQQVGLHSKEMGIHVNFAPAIDINSNPRNPVIGTRAFGEGVNLVSNKGLAYAQGIEDVGVMSVGKHFPGHGDTSTDSHHVLPRIDHDSTRIHDFELVPFKHYIDSGYSGIITAHLAVPTLDPSLQPSSLSKKIVTDLLQKKLGFEGLVFTDGLAMKGVSTQPDFYVRAILAGNDILLAPPNVPLAVTQLREAVAEGRISTQVLEDRVRTILKYKYILGVNKFKAIDLDNLPARLNSIETQILNRTLHAEAMTVLKNENGVLPLGHLDQQRIAVVQVGQVNQNAFTKTLDQYNKHVTFQYTPGMTAQALTHLKTSAREQDLIIVGVSSSKIADRQFIEQLVKGKKYILTFFTTPYTLKAYKNLIDNAEGVVLAYESSQLAGEAAAQVIYGGIPAKGTLSVRITDLYDVGAGLHYSSNRLGFALPEEMQMSSHILSSIDTIVAEGLAEKAFPGCQVLVARNGKIIVQKNYGYTDYEKQQTVQNHSLYDLASLTKALATVPAVMNIRDEYQVKTYQPLSQYIPSMKGTNKEDLTIRQALFHETGLRAAAPFYRMTMNFDAITGRIYQGKKDATHTQQVDRNLYAHKDLCFLPEWISENPTSENQLKVASGIYNKSYFRDSVLTSIIDMEIPKKGHYLYSDLNFVLLRQLVENVSQQPLDEYLTNKLYSPLGAQSLCFNPLDHGVSVYDIAPTENDRFLRHQVIRGYVHDEIAAFSGGVEGNAGLFGNATDIAKVLQLLLNEGVYGGERLLSRETVRLFTLSKSKHSRRGLGFDKPDYQNITKSPTANNVSSNLFGHSGYTGTMFWADTENNLIYIFLTNRVFPDRWNTKLIKGNYRTRIQEVIYNAITQ